jgi:hypothetical protein
LGYRETIKGQANEFSLVKAEQSMTPRKRAPLTEFQFTSPVTVDKTSPKLSGENQSLAKQILVKEDQIVELGRAVVGLKTNPCYCGSSFKRLSSRPIAARIGFPI